MDESGNESDATDRYFVLGGTAVYEKKIHYLTNRIEAIQTKHFPGVQPIDFHSAHIRTGKNFWRKVEEKVRQEVLTDIGSAIVAERVPLFAVAVEKHANLYGENAVELATEMMLKRFDRFLQLKFQEEDDPQRGLLIFSQGRMDKRAAVWVTNFRSLGTQWGALTNICDIPYFASSIASRLLQVADYVSHATWLLYEKRDASLFKPLAGNFMYKDGLLHRLVHFRQPKDVLPACDCPSCYKKPNQFGPWLP